MDAIPVFSTEWYTNPPGASLDDPQIAYVYGKTEAEKAIWKFSEEHPDLDITVCKYRLQPPHDLQPLTWSNLYLSEPVPDLRAPRRHLPRPRRAYQSRLSTAADLFRLIYPHGYFHPFNGYIDARDTARLHVLARRNENSDEPAKAAHKRCSWDRPIPQANEGPLVIKTDVDEDPGDDERDDGQDFERRQPVFWIM